ncbi:MAG: hypothetical protein H6R10_994 [Rhodocyclaceae bacterium]|nr:hypothetical protein [Rhodocyclaceae bacterium]
MDIWFTLFVAVIALAAAAGFSLVLVGYINALPASVAGGRNWLWAVLVIPSAIVAVPVAIAFILTPFAEVMAPATLARWLAIPALVLHGGALIRFFATHWQGNEKTAKQLGGGLLLLALAVGGLYGAGPMFAERVVANVK